MKHTYTNIDEFKRDVQELGLTMKPADEAVSVEYGVFEDESKMSECRLRFAGQAMADLGFNVPHNTVAIAYTLQPVDGGPAEFHGEIYKEERGRNQIFIERGPDEPIVEVLDIGYATLPSTSDDAL